MADTGWVSPSSITNDSSVGAVAWSNPGNAVASDNSDAVFLSDLYAGLQESYYLKAVNFGFNIPINATIDGIEVAVEAQRTFGSTNDAFDSQTRLVLSDTSIGSTNRATGAEITGTEQYYTYGSNSDIWGEVLTPGDINSRNFGVVFSAKADGDAPGQVSIDHIRIKVYYTEATNTGYKSPTATGEYNNDWSNPANAYSDDGTYTTAGNDDIQGLYVSLSWNDGTNYTPAQAIPLTSTDTTYILGGAGDQWSRNWVASDFSNSNFKLKIKSSFFGFDINQDYYDFTLNVPADATILGIEVSVEARQASTLIYVDHLQVKIYYSVVAEGLLSTDFVYSDTQVDEASPPSDGDGWNNAEVDVEAENEDPVNGDMVISQSGYTGYLTVSDFGLSIPSSAVIKGILVELRGNTNSTTDNVEDKNIVIVKGGVKGSSDRKIARTWPRFYLNTSAVRQYGGKDDLWGETWTASDINSSDFGIAVNFQVNSSSSNDIYIDYIRIKVYYEEGGVTQTVLVSPSDTATGEASPVTFVWEIPSDPDNDPIHAHIQIDDTDDTFASIESEKFSFRDSGFEYYNGSSWVEYPANGVTSTYYGNQARISIGLTGGTKYWRVRGGVK